MALTMNRIAPSLFVVALLAIASLTRPGTRRPQTDPIPTFGVYDLQQRVSRATVLLEAVNRRDSIIRSLPESINAEAPLFAMDERLPSAHRSIVTRAVQRQWKSLGIARAEVPVVVAVVVDTTAFGPGFGTGRRESFDYVIPSAGDAGGVDRCIVIVALHAPDLVRVDRVAFGKTFATPNSASQLLGPCAFVARFGAPGPQIDRWLRDRSYDLAAYPRWYPLTQPEGADMAERWRAANTNNELMAQQPSLSLSRQALGCTAGMTHHCASTLSAAAPSNPTPAGGVVMIRVRWDRHWALMTPRYLSDLVTALGPQDFRRFWTSPLAPEAALSAVAGRPLAVWTHQWAVGLVGAQRVGAAVSLADLASALTLVLLSAAMAAWGWSRRQVR